jgi:hypothetical protein
MALGETVQPLIERDDASAMPAGEGQQMGVGHLAMTRKAGTSPSVIDTS